MMRDDAAKGIVVALALEGATAGIIFIAGRMLGVW
jgi:hypothetical protein